MFHPVLALDTPLMLMITVAIGAVLFGGDKLVKLARSAGQAKKEFALGQIEADEAAAKAREEARARATPGTTEPSADQTNTQH